MQKNKEDLSKHKESQHKLPMFFRNVIGHPWPRGARAVTQGFAYICCQPLQHPRREYFLPNRWQPQGHAPAVISNVHKCSTQHLC